LGVEPILWVIPGGLLSGGQRNRSLAASVSANIKASETLDIDQRINERGKWKVVVLGQMKKGRTLF